MNRGHTHDHGQAITLVVLWISIILFIMFVQPVHSAEKSMSSGKVIALNLCQACHVFKGANQAGTVGPPFASMSQRFPKRERLRSIIYDPQKAKPNTMMPPFGRHGFLDKKQTEKLIDFIYTL